MIRYVLMAWLATLASPALAADIQPGDWRLVIKTEIGDLPFNLHLDRDSAGWHAAFINGVDKAQAEAVTVAGDKLTVTFPSFGTRIEATLGANGAVTGTARYERAEGQVTIPFTGKAGESYRFFPKPAAGSTSANGRWAVTEPDGDAIRRGVGEFKQTGAVVNGSVIFMNADTRFLSGEMHGDDLYLATFDGGQGSLWVGHFADGKIVGKTYSLVSRTVTPFEAKLDANAQIDDPSKLTYLKPGYDKFAFKFPNLEGKQVSLDDPAYKGKVVIVTIAGSWCSTCHDETAYLSPYYKANRKRGVEVIGLMYEYSPEFPKAVSACKNFQKRYDIAWDMLIAGISDKTAAGRTLPMINAVLAYPTMIVVDKKGKVRRIHTSFPRPATGARHEEFKREFESFMDQLLAEPA